MNIFSDGLETVTRSFSVIRLICSHRLSCFKLQEIAFLSKPYCKPTLVNRLN